VARGSARWAVVLKPRSRFGVNLASRAADSESSHPFMTTHTLTMTEARLAVAVDERPLIFSREGIGWQSSEGLISTRTWTQSPSRLNTASRSTSKREERSSTAQRTIITERAT
jgi:hypothetical protein